MNKNKDLLKSFSEYCKERPELRFWQALVNWSGWDIYAEEETARGNRKYYDVFYWEETNLKGEAKNKSKYPFQLNR